jgi:uncharacterized protein (TIGR03382 family)
MLRSSPVLLAAVVSCSSPLPSATTGHTSQAVLSAQPEQPLTQPIPRSPQLNGQTHVKLASDGTGYLAVWLGGATASVEATRIAADGTVLDVPPIVIPAYGPLDCAVSFDGQDYVVAYTQFNGSTTFNDALLQRVGTDGSLPGAPIPVAAPATHYGGSSYVLQLGCGSRQCTVEWRDQVPPPVSGPFTYNLKARRFDMLSGNALEAEVLLGSVTGGNGWQPAPVAISGGSELITMDQALSSGLYASLIPPGGGYGPVQELCAQSGGYPYADAFGAAGSPDGGLYVVLIDSDFGAGLSGSSLIGSRVSPAGAVVDSCGHWLDTPPNGALDQNPHVAWSGSDWLVAWWETPVSRATVGAGYARVSNATGSVTASGVAISVPVIAVDNNDIQVACASDSCAFAWADARVTESINGTPTARFARLLPDGGTPDGTGELIALASNGQRKPALAAQGSGFFAAWSDFRDSVLNVYGAHVSSVGQALETTGVGLAPGTRLEQSPSVACSTDMCLTVWQQSDAGEYASRIAFARVLNDGGLLDPGGTILAQSGTNNGLTTPIVAEQGGRFLVAYLDSSVSALKAQIVEPYAGSDGGVIAIGSPAGFPGVASTGGSWTVSWWGYGPMMVRHVGPAGALLDSATTIASVGTSAMSSGAASNGADAFVYWVIYPGGFQGRLVPADGGAVGPTVTFDPNAFSSSPVVFGPEGWQGVWLGYYDGGFGVLTALAQNDGGVARPTVVADAPAYNVAAPAAAATTSRVLVAFERGAADAGNVRIDEVVLDELQAQGTACAHDADCVSGHCVDGVCCDTACGGGDPADCQSCAPSGTCTVLDTTHVCRPDAGSCDVAERCDGVAATCPADAFLPTTVTCRASAGPCDVAELCPGDAGSCPSDALAPTTTQCRASAGPCDVAESCSGTSAACPADAFAPASTMCRPSAGVCDVDESCTGTSAACPADAFAPATTLCRAAVSSCDVAESCTGTAAACPADQSVPDDSACDDGDPCTEHDICVSGTCGGAALSCPVANECHTAAMCQRPSGTCSSAAKPDGTVCSTGTCQSGTCVSAPMQQGCGCQSAGSLAAALGMAAFVRLRRRRR